MKSRLEGIPPYSTEASTIPAALFNEVRLAILRLDKSLNFPIPGLRTLELILDEEAWIVIDASLNEIPVLAWTDFETRDRSNLHQPISCRLITYHAHAKLILEKVKQAIHKELDMRLHKNGHQHSFGSGSPDWK